eukprot:COSAG02_NODE_7729_length_2872_cov_3.996033_2_plen_120_part_00
MQAHQWGVWWRWVSGQLMFSVATTLPGTSSRVEAQERTLAYHDTTGSPTSDATRSPNIPTITSTWRWAELAAVVHVDPAAEVGLAVQHTPTKLTHLHWHMCALKSPCGLARSDRFDSVI